MFDVLIKDGLIVDGTGGPSYLGDILIKNGRIIKIDKNICAEALEVVEAAGLVVAPGFIDVHSHNDLVPFMDENIKNLKLMQGVTTELVGQCGLGVVPSESRDNIWKNYIKGIVGAPEYDWNFRSFSEYLSKIELAGLKNNYCSLISHGAIRTSIIGFEDRLPSKTELESMCILLKNAMEEGAFGMSIGLQYLPAVFSKKEELSALCKIVADYNGIVMVHLRNHNNTIVSALNEIAEIAEGSGVRLHISHMRSYKSKVLGCCAEKLLAFIEKSMKKGVYVTFDEHLYLSGSTLLTQLLPPWVTAGGTEEMVKNLSDRETVMKIKKELSNKETQYVGWDNYSAVTGWEGILITSVNKKDNLKFIGNTVGNISTKLGIHPVDFVSQLLIEEKSGVGIVTLGVFSQEDTVKLIRHPLQMVGSDSIPAGVPHPRLYGNYPLFVGKFVRELKSISLEEAVYKSTLLPAKTLGFNNIGELTINKMADIVLFDFNEIKGYEDYLNPTKAPGGIKYVLLNGRLAVKDGQVSKKQFGRTIRHR